MGQVLHGCARMTEAVRREIQNSKESVKAQKAISGKVWCAAVYPSPKFNDFNEMYQVVGAEGVRNVFCLFGKKLTK